MTMKKLTLVCAAVVALTLAGPVGAVVRDTIFTITPKHFARLAGTDVYCKNRQFPNDFPSFLCDRFGTNGKRKRRTDVVEVKDGRVAVGFPPKSPVLEQFPQIPGWYPGVVNTIVGGNVTVVKSGQWAQLGTTSVYCQAYIEKGTHQPGFDCGDWAGNHHVGGSYSAIIDEQGVEVDRWDTSGHHVHRVVTYLNP
jgi:hypothetical protein